LPPKLMVLKHKVKCENFSFFHKVSMANNLAAHLVLSVNWLRTIAMFPRQP